MLLTFLARKHASLLQKVCLKRFSLQLIGVIGKTPRCSWFVSLSTTKRSFIRNTDERFSTWVKLVSASTHLLRKSFNFCRKVFFFFSFFVNGSKICLMLPHVIRRGCFLTEQPLTSNKSACRVKQGREDEEEEENDLTFLITWILWIFAQLCFDLNVSFLNKYVNEAITS